MTKITYATPDKNGDVPDMSLLYHVLHHKERDTYYVLTDYVWNAKTDEWDGFYTSDETPVPFTRHIRQLLDGRFEITDSVGIIGHGKLSDRDAAVLDDWFAENTSH